MKFGFFGQLDFMSIWQISRHCFWTRNDKFSLEVLHDNL